MRVSHLSDIIIAVGVTLRKLAGKCVCLVERQGGCVFPAPGVACWAGVEKIAYGLRRCIEEHSMDVSSNLICKMLSMLSPDSLYWMYVLHFPQSSYHGYIGAMGSHPLILHPLGQSMKCSKVTPSLRCQAGSKLEG